MSTEEATSERKEYVTKDNVVEISGLKQHDEAINNGNRLVIFYHASWAKPSEHMKRIYETLHKQHVEQISKQPNAYTPVEMYMVDMSKKEENGDIIKTHKIESVPLFLMYNNNRLCKRIEGARNEELIKQMKWMSEASDDMLLTSACEMIIQNFNKSEIMVIMKGNPNGPRCPFSKRMIDRLRKSGIVFDYFDILSDSLVRDRMKEVASWETYPMLFAKGELVGGIDKVEKLSDENRLVSELSRPNKSDLRSTSKINDDDKLVPKHQPKHQPEQEETQTLTERLDELTQSHDIMLFMKGNPSEPRCGFSRKMVQVLGEHSIDKYETFDILTDNDVRQGLKSYSNWPTFPQLYVKGKFVGGLDIVNEMSSMGDLPTQLGIGISNS